MNDFAKTLEAKSDQVNNADLSAGPQTIKITKVNVNMRDDQPVSMSFQGSDKVYRPCKGMRRLIAQIWGDDPSVYIGRGLTIYRDPDVTFGKDQTGGTRISHASNINGEQKITVPVSRGRVKTYTIRPLAVDEAPAPPENALQMAQDAAGKGVDAFRLWWNSEEGKLCRPVAQPKLEELKKVAAAADMPIDEDAEPDDGPVFVPDEQDDDEPPM
jgi:hypothetical protein